MHNSTYRWRGTGWVLGLLAGVVSGQALPQDGPAQAAPVQATAAGGASTPDAPPTVQAVWIEHKLRFTYFGRTTFYSCDGLRDKVRYLLHQVGARRDDLSVVMACFDNTGPQDLPGVRIRAHLPAEATPALLAKLEEDEPRRTLIARVQGKGKDLDAATAQFPASWRTVEIEGRRNRHIEDGDCELIEQMIDDVLVPLGVRVAADSRVHCSANQVQIGSVKLKVESLQRLPEPDVAAPPAGASGPGETGDKVPVIPDTGAVETATQH